MQVKSNDNANLLHIIRQTRDSVISLSSSADRIASGVRFSSAGDDPGAIGSVVLNERAVRGIQQELKGLNEGISIAQQASDHLSQVQTLLSEVKGLANAATSAQYTDDDRASFQREVEGLLQEIEGLTRETADQEVQLEENLRSIQSEGSDRSPVVKPSKSPEVSIESTEVKIDYDRLKFDPALAQSPRVDEPSRRDSTPLDRQRAQSSSDEQSRSVDRLDRRRSTELAVDLATTAITSLSAYQNKLSQTRSVTERVLNFYQDRRDFIEERLTRFQDPDSAELTASERVTRGVTTNVLLEIDQLDNSRSLLSLMRESLSDPRMLAKTQEDAFELEPPQSNPTIERPASQEEGTLFQRMQGEDFLNDKSISKESKSAFNQFLKSLDA
jgi:hypothetical protein